MTTSGRRAGAVGLAVAVAALSIAAFIDAAVATALTTLTAFVTALIGVAWQVSDSRQRARTELSYSYFERWNREEMLKCRDTAQDILSLNGRTADKAWTDWKELTRTSRLKALEALTVLAFFEELAGHYNRGGLDNEATAEYLGRSSITLWENSAWLIGRYRQENANYCNEWKHMLDQIRTPLERRFRAAATAAAGLSPEQALEVDFEPPVLRLPRMPAGRRLRTQIAGGTDEEALRTAADRLRRV